MKKMRILPVYPKFPPSFWGYKYALNFIDVPSQMPPLGLATVAAMLPQEHFDVNRIIDLNVEPLRDEDIQAADLVFFSSMLVQKKSQEESIAKVQALGKKAVAGGPYPTSYPEAVKADYLVLGEAEASLPSFLEDILSGNMKRVYNKNDGPDKGKLSLQRTPIPRWDLINVKNYATLAIQYSRGCPFDCEFCEITNLFGRTARTKTTEQMIEELNAVYNTGWKGSVFIVDDNFIGNKTKVRELLPAIKSWQEQHNYPFALFTEAGTELGSPNHKDILEEMVAAGFDQVFVGIESPDADVLGKMNKKQNSGLHEKIKNIQRAGLEVMGGFIIGSDGEKPEVFQNLFKFIQETGIVIPMVGLLNAAKNTKLYRRLLLEDRLRGEPSGNNTHQLEFNFKPELDEEFLINGYVDILEKLFDSKNFYERCQTLDECRGHYHSTSAVSTKDLKAFGRILYQNLIRAPDLQFVKYALETVITHPRHFPEAITRAVKLHHFKKITKATADIYHYQDVTESIYKRFEKKVGKLKDKFAGDTEVQWQRLQELSHDMLEKANKKYHKINEDFRADAKRALDNLVMKIDNYMQNYRLEL